MKLVIAILAALALVQASAAHSQPDEGAARYPWKPIRWILPFPPGGPSDALARLVGQRLGERLKQPVVIENRAGAAGSIGIDMAARAIPDGHTIVFGAPGSVVINPILHGLGSDPLVELAPVSRLATFAFVIVAHPGLPAHTIAELIEVAKARPGAMTCGAGAALQQIACELLSLQAGAKITTVPYKGSAPAMNDLIAGQISFVFEVPNVAIGQVSANRVRALATTSAQVSTGPFAHLPRLSETLPGLDLESWFGVLAPRATPREIVARLDEELRAIISDEGLRKRLLDAGLEPAHASPEAFAEIIRRDRMRYSKVVREAGIKGEGS